MSADTVADPQLELLLRDLEDANLGLEHLQDAYDQLGPRIVDAQAAEGQALDEATAHQTAVANAIAAAKTRNPGHVPMPDDAMWRASNTSAAQALDKQKDLTAKAQAAAAEVNRLVGLKTRFELEGLPSARARISDIEGRIAAHQAHQAALRAELAQQPERPSLIRRLLSHG